MEAMTFDEMRLLAGRAFGDRGERTVLLWRQYNRAYFNHVLRPIPIIYVPTSTYGHWVGLTHSTRLIYLMDLGEQRPWPYVRGVLLHEMVHQHGEHPEAPAPRKSALARRDHAHRPRLLRG